MSEIRSDVLIVPVAAGIQLTVTKCSNTTAAASLYLGDWPRGRRMATSVRGAEAKARVDVDEVDGSATLWLGTMTVDLPWADLLAVADFLRLEIPVRSTEQVPA